MSPDRPEDRTEASSPLAGPLPGENRVIWIVWWTYGAFYFCRTNISTAVAANPGLGTSISEGGLELTSEEIGWILASLKLSYALGQLVNGQLSERLPPRVLLAIGMFGSAALNILFGLSTGFYFLLFIWACNGYCQSLGWTPCVRVVSNWIPVLRRGRAIGIIGTGYQITLGLTFLIASQAAEHWGWRYAFYIPAAILVAAGCVMLFFLRESPEDHPLHRDHPHPPLSDTNQQHSFVDNLILTLTNPALWLMGLSLGLLNACRYGFLDWGLKHLTEVQRSTVGKEGLKFVVLAGGAVAGSYLAGWATDRFFGSRRGPVICLLLILLGGLTLLYEKVAPQSNTGTIILLFFIGFCIYGPQVLLVGTAPADLARRGTSAAAAGFVNFMGYLGAALGDVVTGYVSPEKTPDGLPPPPEAWQTAIYLWAGWAFLAAIASALLWNTTAHAKTDDASPSSEENINE